MALNKPVEEVPYYDLPCGFTNKELSDVFGMVVGMLRAENQSFSHPNNSRSRPARAAFMSNEDDASLKKATDIHEKVIHEMYGVPAYFG